jgi:hypothetical protein
LKWISQDLRKKQRNDLRKRFVHEQRQAHSEEAKATT